MSPLRRTGIAALVVALGLGGLSISQHRIDALRLPADPDQSLLYLPNEKLLTHFTGGMSSVVADILWLQCVQYIATHYQTDKKFVWLNHMCDTITRLDSYFAGVYRYGAVFMSELKADSDASLDLLHRGMIKCPHAWELPYEAASVYLLDRGYLPYAQRLAAAYMEMAIATGNAPPYVVEHAEAILAHEDLFDIERKMWESVLKTEKGVLRQVAEQKLAELDAREACRDLTKVVQQFNARFGRLPNDLQELVEKRAIRYVPEDRLGGRFFMDRDGEVQNTAVLDARLERRLTILRDVIDKFHAQYGRWPHDLDELMSSHILLRKQDHPYKDRNWRYDPATGKVEG